ncbi:hypothetical protein ACQF36_37125 [Streptomyces sp. Marseille-Q5077]|uniref:hypothetical protein n=1 Tax=Streptomyces sp. Marseille-Q5077 TaxID=3418995 RepID=UPI003D05A23A
MNPGDLASTLVVFLEDRHGKALVRLPNGSKTSLPHECLDLVEVGEHLPDHVSRDDLTLGPVRERYRWPARSHGDPLLSTLAEAMAHLVAAVDTSTDEEASPDAASRWFEYPAYLFDRLGAEDRHRLADLFRDAAMKEPEGTWRDALLEVPDGFGLNEDEG